MYIVGINSYSTYIKEQYQTNYTNFIDYIDIDNFSEVAKTAIDPNSLFLITELDSVKRMHTVNTLTNLFELSPDNFPNFSIYNSCISKNTKMGIGNIFLSYSELMDNAVIGDFNIFNSKSYVGFSAKIGSYNNFGVSSVLEEDVIVGDRNSFESNCVVTKGMHIFRDNIVQKGECLFDNLATNQILQSGVTFKRHDNLL